MSDDYQTIASSEVIVIAGDRARIQTNRGAANVSDYMKTAISNCTPSADTLPLVHINHIEGQILRKVIEWCEYHQYYINMVMQPQDIINERDEWNSSFFAGMNHETLQLIFFSADYLCIEHLMNATYRVLQRRIATDVESHNDN